MSSDMPDNSITKKEQTDNISLQEIEERLQKFEEEEAKHRSEFYALYDERKKKMEARLDDIKNEIINSALSVKTEKVDTPARPATFDTAIDMNEYEKFQKHPYFIYPGGKNTVYVVVPKFYPSFQVGWLKDEIDGVWNRFEVNQYAVLFGTVPEQIREHLDIPTPIPASIDGNTITFSPEDKKTVKRRLAHHVTDWTDNGARITRGNEYTIIDQILQSGHIPFIPKPVKDEHIVHHGCNIKLRAYQQPAWHNFLKHGAVGIFHPTGSGKSFIGMVALGKIRVENRRNLIISPKRTLVSQWAEYMAEHIPEALEHTLITTYQGFHDYDEKFGVVIYDECRRLPAKTFSRLSTITTEYRMGCDATPYREDGKNHLIVALTGFPQSLNWQKYMRQYGPGYHAINVHIVKTERAKITKAVSLYDSSKRTMFYSYHLDIGSRLAKSLSLPFIDASTGDRLEIMRDNRSFVASSVFSEGVHIEDLDRIIEIDFHFGSRQEEMQLSGRLMHSKQKHKVHHIIMTYEEFEKYRKRLLSLEGNGFHVRLIEDG